MTSYGLEDERGAGTAGMSICYNDSTPTPPVCVAYTAFM